MVVVVTMGLLEDWTLVAVLSIITVVVNGLEVKPLFTDELTVVGIGELDAMLVMVIPVVVSEGIILVLVALLVESEVFNEEEVTIMDEVVRVLNVVATTVVII